MSRPAPTAERAGHGAGEPAGRPSGAVPQPARARRASTELAANERRDRVGTREPLRSALQLWIA
jgi:hypothetical protein